MKFIFIIFTFIWSTHLASCIKTLDLSDQIRADENAASNAAVTPFLHPTSIQVVFTNIQPISGREGDPRPDWLGWGAQAFAIALDGTFWIADSAAHPQRLIHLDRQGELIDIISLDSLNIKVFDLAVTQNSIWVLDLSAQPAERVQLDFSGSKLLSVDFPPDLHIGPEDEPVQNEISSLLIGNETDPFLIGSNGIYQLKTKAISGSLKKLG